MVRVILVLCAMLSLAAAPATRPILTRKSADATQLTQARKMTIYIVPHSHVDIGYTQLQPEIEAKQTQNLLTALDMIEKSKANAPGSQYRWTVEAAWTIDQFIRRHPEKREQLLVALQSKQVELDAAYANMLTGLCRPEELLRAYARGVGYGKEFGVDVKSAMISDVPGYTWGTVTALAHAGVRYFSVAPNFMDRIGTTMVAWQDKPFYWQSPDGGHKVLVWVPFTGYAWSHIIKKLEPQHIEGLVRHLDEVGYPFDITYIRWSGHGDNAVPDPGLIESVKKWNETYAWPKLVMSTVSEPFEALERAHGDKLPTVSGDWTPYWEDGAASSALETAMNRATAERLVAAETLFAMLHPRNAFPSSAFRAAWTSTMLYSEHTWGAHCSISDPENPLTTGQWKYKRGYATDADAQSTKLMSAALEGSQPIANAIDVFNTTSWLRTQVVEVSNDVGDRVTGSDGQPVPSQRLSSGALAFLAADVPAQGSRRFVISKGDAFVQGVIRASTASLENNQLSIKMDPATGAIHELISNGHNYASKNGLNEYLYVQGNKFDQPAKVLTSTIIVRDAGPLVGTLLIESDAPGCRKLTREVRLTSDADHVELLDLLDKTRADVKPHQQGGNPQDPNNGKEAIHFAFPFNVPDAQVRMDIPWAVVQPEKDQIPGACKNWFSVQRFVDISNAERGVTWTQIDTPLVQVGGITATLIGSQTNPSVWQRTVQPSSTLYSWAMNNYWHTNYRAYQEGRTTFHYAIRPHAGYSAVAAQRFGTERSQPLIVAPAIDRTPADAPRLTLTTTDVTITAFKPSDDGKAHIIRLFACAGNDVEVKLEWAGRRPDGVYLSDTLERRGQKVEQSIKLPAWGVSTLRVE